MQYSHQVHIPRVSLSTNLLFFPRRSPQDHLNQVRLISGSCSFLFTHLFDFSSGLKYFSPHLLVTGFSSLLKVHCFFFLHFLSDAFLGLWRELHSGLCSRSADLDYWQSWWTLEMIRLGQRQELKVGLSESLLLQSQYWALSFRSKAAYYLLLKLSLLQLGVSSSTSHFQDITDFLWSAPSADLSIFENWYYLESDLDSFNR